MSARLPVFVLLSSCIALVASACGGRVDSDLLGAPPTSSSSSSSSGSTSSSSSSSSSSGSSGTSSSSSSGGSSSSSGSSGNCDAVPACDSGDTSFNSPNDCPKPTPGGATVCYSRAVCGNTIWCAPVCNTKPACPVGSIEMIACDGANNGCFNVTQCGTTILCSPQCEGPAPVCDAGDKQIADQNGCLDDGVCYTRSSCGVTIWCTGPSK